MNPDFDAIKKSTDIVAVIERYGVPLKKQGNDHVGLCPFHDDHNPSLRVTPSKGLFHCMACGAAGNVIQFVAKKEGITDKAAALKLTGSIPGIQRGSDMPQPPAPTAPASHPELFAAILDHYHKTLLGRNRRGLDYLKARGLSDPAMLAHFKIGYVDHTLKSKLTPAQVKLAQDMGLFNDRRNETFWNRVVVPIYDEAGQPVGLSGRDITGQMKSKYINLAGPQRGVWNGGAAAAYGPILPTITNAGNTGSIGGGAVVLYKDAYITFDHFALTRGFWVQGTNYVTVQNCDMEGGYTGNAFEVRGTNNNLTINGNHIRHWSNGYWQPYDPGNTSTNLVITNNVFEYFINNMMEIGEWTGFLFDHNIVRYIYDPTGASHNDGIQFTGFDYDSTITNNIFCHSGDQLNFFQPAEGSVDTLYVANNLYYDCDAVAIQNQNCTNAQYINNTVVNTNTGGLWLRGAANDTIVSNNVLQGPDAFDGSGKAAYEDYNIVPTSATVTGAHDQKTNSPGFINTACDDYHPAAASNVMTGHGGTVYTTTTDLPGITRSATAPTVGAYETATSTSEPTMSTYEAEETYVSASSQTMTVTGDTNANGGVYRTLPATAVGNSVNYRLRIPNPGLYHILARVLQHPTGGQFQLTVNGGDQAGVQDLYASANTYSVLDLGYRVFGVPGQQNFTFTVTGKNGASSGYDIPLDYIQVYPQIWQAEYLADGALEGNISHATTVTYDPAASDQNYVVSHSLTVGGAKDTVAFTLPVFQAGTYDVKLRVLKSSNLGQFQLSINGTNYGAVQDLYSATNTYAVIDFGNVTFTSATNAKFVMTVVGQNPASSDCQLSLDYAEIDQ